MLQVKVVEKNEIKEKVVELIITSKKNAVIEGISNVEDPLGCIASDSDSNRIIIIGRQRPNTECISTGLLLASEIIKRFSETEFTNMNFSISKREFKSEIEFEKFISAFALSFIDKDVTLFITNNTLSDEYDEYFE